MKLSDIDIIDLIERLNNNKDIPEDYKYKLFPTIQKEYELVYAGKMRKEDILANEDGVFPVPLQVDKLYNGKRDAWDDGWKNMIVFGDNLQFLKTVYENKDPLIKDKIKGKVKLIYIDPPFATESEFKSNQGQTAYIDKTKGASFLELIRRRIIVARELLARNGCILVHLDYRYKHHIKVIMDEIFGKSNFKNEIVANRTKKNVKEREKVKKLNEEFDTILLYSLNEEFRILPPMRNDYKPDRWHGFDAAGFRNGMDYDLFGNKPAKSRHWHWAEENARKAVSNYQVWENQFSTIESIGDYYRRKKVDGIELQFIRPKNKTAIPEYFIPQSETSLCNNLWNDISVLSYEHSYPTEKSEKLLYRIIEAVTDKNDLVMDFFAGSGTTAAVAEKLNRKWIVCDIGKLSFYTIQNRILNIKSSKSVEDSKKKYNKEAKSFLTINTGHYSLEKVFQLIRTEYQKFVMSLFEIDAITKTINGIKIDGQKKDGFYAMIWPYWEFPDSTVNETYLNELHNNIGKKVGNRLYIIAPASYVDYISDYCVIGDVKYFFLKVPYHIIKELHNVHFKKTRQPQSKKNVNALDDAIGFHFMMKPDVDSEISITDGMVSITINKFLSSYFEEDTDRILENYESLAIVLIDKKFNGNEFDLDKYYFAEDLLPKKKKKKENDDDDDQEEINIQEELKQVAKIIIPPFPLGECGKRICIIYIDIYGNEFKEEYQIDHSARR